jgi:hypothetical protein
MSDTEEILAAGIGGAAVRAGARRGRGIRRNLKAKLTCFSPVLSGGRIGAAQPQREISQFESGWEPPPRHPGRGNSFAHKRTASHPC